MNEEKETTLQKIIEWFFKLLVCLIAFQCIHLVHNSWDHTMIVNEVLKTNIVNQSLPIINRRTQLINAPAVRVSEIPKVEPELPVHLIPMFNPTNELQMTNAIQNQDEILEWLNQLETNR